MSNDPIDFVSGIIRQYSLCLRRIVVKFNWPLPIRAFQDHCKQTMINIQINITRLRIPTDRRQTSWLLFKLIASHYSVHVYKYIFVKKTSLKNLSGNSQLTVSHLSADCQLFVSRQLADRQPTGFALNTDYQSPELDMLRSLLMPVKILLHCSPNLSIFSSAFSFWERSNLYATF